MGEFRLETERLVLREWREADVAPFQRICSDPKVMMTLGPPLDLAATADLVARMQRRQTERGHCCWALERREDARLIGWYGPIVSPAGPIAGKVEIGWRLVSDCWGFGYATEAAVASLDWAFANLPDDDVWALTSVANRRSRSVMQRIGMSYVEGDDFDHPAIPEGDPLRRHVLYRITRPR